MKNNRQVLRSLAWMSLLLAMTPVAAQDDFDWDELFAEPEPSAQSSAPSSQESESSPQQSDSAGNNGDQGQAFTDDSQSDSIQTVPVQSVSDKDESEQTPPKRAPRQIEEIVVTATKREASIRELTISVSALTGEDMEAAGLQDVDDIVNAVPGVNIVDPNSGEAKRITIRGISAGGVATPATSGVFIGETPFTDAGQPRVNLDANPFDMASVEVLKGPVGTLFGGSGLNGAIRYLPNQPVYDAWEGKAFYEVREFRYGGRGAVIGGALNLPLLDEAVALRVVGFDRETAGYLDTTHPSYSAQDVNATRQDGLRAILGWQPNADLNLSLMYIEQSTTTDDISATDNAEGRFERGDTPAPSPRDSEYQLLSLTANWDVGFADLVGVVSELDKSYDIFLDATNRSGLNNTPDTVLGQATVGGGTARSQELRLVSNDASSRWEWLIGAFNYEHRVQELATLQAATPVALPPGLPGGIGLGDLLPNGFLDNSGNVFAVYDNINALVAEQAYFGELSWRFLNNFKGTVGLRLYDFEYNTRIVSEGAGASLRDPAQPGRAVVNPQATESGSNPKCSLAWEPSDDFMSYLTVARGFRFGGTNANGHPETPPTYRSDSLWNWELGVRTSWLDRALIADAAVYYVDWQDAQVLRFTSDGTFGYNDNVGAVEGRGAEGVITWLPPIDGLSLNATVAYADIRTSEAFEDVPAGTPWPLAPRWQTSAAISWAGTLSDIALGVSATHQHHGKARGLLENDVEVFGYNTVNLQLTLASISRPNWPRLALNANNLTDERGVTFVNIFANNVESYIAPFNVSLRASIDF